MIINNNLKKFLELIYLTNQNFKTINERDLKTNFKNNEYYNLRKFCIENKIITIKFNEIDLTLLGIEFFKVLNKLELF